jgi:GT2 family glycosyltransferase
MADLDEYESQLTSELVNRIQSIFSPQWYLDTNGDVAESGLDPFEHFISFGFNEGRGATPLFDQDFYCRRAAVPVRQSPLIHYLLVGGVQGYDPHPLMNNLWYRKFTPGVQKDQTILEHYCTYATHQSINPHPLFSASYYNHQRQVDPDILVTPLEDFVVSGFRQGLNPCAGFNTDLYVQEFRDVRDSSINPLIHYVLHGRHESSRNSFFRYIDVHWYSWNYQDDPLLYQIGAIAHYLNIGAPLGLKSSGDPIIAELGRTIARLQNNSDDLGQRIKNLVLPLHHSPLVSIIVPTLNHCNDVVECLASIVSSNPSTTYEVIVVDDGSDERELALLSDVPNLRFLRLDTNQGFAAATTAGINLTQAEYIVLLNNDTVVLQGWLDQLVKTVESDDQIGLVGSKILREDLLVQEVGGSVTRSGYAFQNGTGQEVQHWNLQLPREVDYCSAASLLIRRSVWDQVGGFDPQFLPAYYEDTDLCFQARNNGFSTFCNPRSIVIHREGTSHGNDGLGLKRFQYRNREYFYEKWKQSLLHHSSEATPLQSSHWRHLENIHSDHVLIFDSSVPDPTTDSGSKRMFEFCRNLSERGIQVHLFAVNGGQTQPATHDLEDIGVEVISGSLTDPQIQRHFQVLSGILNLIIVSRPDVATKVMNSILTDLANVPLVYDMVDAHGQRFLNEAELKNDYLIRRKGEKFRLIEQRLASVADGVITVSETDQEYISELAKHQNNYFRIGNFHPEVDPGNDFSNRSGLIFVGGFNHSPNIDAVEFFVAEVFPLVRHQIPDIHLTIVGTNPPDSIRGMQSNSVTVTGWVEDISGLYHQACVSVAPLRFGAGVKGKIGEALNFGVPVVTTNIGADGMGLQHKHDVLIANTAQDFARSVIDCYTNPELWNTLRANGRLTIQEVAGTQAMKQQVDKLLTSFVFKSHH